MSNTRRTLVKQVTTRDGWTSVPDPALPPPVVSCWESTEGLSPWRASESHIPQSCGFGEGSATPILSFLQLDGYIDRKLGKHLSTGIHRYWKMLQTPLKMENVQEQIRALFIGIQPRCINPLVWGGCFHTILFLVGEGSLARLFLLSDSHITKDIYRNNMISNNFSLNNTQTKRTFNQFKNFNMFKLTYGWDTLQTCMKHMGRPPTSGSKNCFS